MVKCDNCGVEIADSFKLCPNCGNDLSKVKKPAEEENISEGNVCKTCGHTLKEGLKFCPSCGSKVEIKYESKSCTNCGTPIEKGTIFCPECGTPVNSQLNASDQFKYCVECGSKINANANVCPKCGFNQINQPLNVAFDRKPWLSVVLSLILPGLGHFYLNLNRKGLIYLMAWIVISVFSYLLLFNFFWIAIIISIIGLIVKIYSMYDSYVDTVSLSEGKQVKDKFSFEDAL